MNFFETIDRVGLVLIIALGMVGCIQDGNGDGAGGAGGVGASGGSGGNAGNGGSGGSGPDHCDPGSLFIADDGCNNCICPDSGLRSEAACDEEDCGDRCEPGSNFRADDGCNTCQCPENGVRSDAACTERACDNLCTPGESFPAADGCNTCQCPESGRRDEAPCTDRACINPCDGLMCGTACNPGDSGAGFMGPAGPPADRAQHFCNADGQCVPERQGASCDDPCSGLSCGDDCFPGANGADEPADPEAPSAFPQRAYQCNVAGECIPADPDNLHCEDRCQDIECGQPCHGATADGPSSAENPDGQADRLMVAPSVELCNAEGACVEVEGPESLMCPGPFDPCEGVQCGDVCNTPPATGRTPGNGGVPGADLPGLQAPVGLCNGAGECVPADTSLEELMCGGSDTCRPGEPFPADDGCNTCQCPESGQRDEAACTEVACVDPSCQDHACGDPCQPQQANSGAQPAPPADPPGEEDEVAPRQFACNAELQCVIDRGDLGCGM